MTDTPRLIEESWIRFAIAVEIGDAPAIQLRPGLSRRARRRRRGERAAILRELSQPDGPTAYTLEKRYRAALRRAGDSA